MFYKLHVLGMDDDLWDRVCGLGREGQKTRKTWECFQLLVFLTRLRGTGDKAEGDQHLTP